MVAGHTIAMALRKAYLSMHRRAEASLRGRGKRVGLTANQFLVLWTLAEEDGLSQRELGERVQSDPNTLRPVLRALEEARWVLRKRHPQDQRVRSVQLTKLGRRHFESHKLASDSFRNDLTGLFSNKEAQLLLSLLSRVADPLVVAD